MLYTIKIFLITNTKTNKSFLHGGVGIKLDEVLPSLASTHSEILYYGVDSFKVEQVDSVITDKDSIDEVMKDLLEVAKEKYNITSTPQRTTRYTREDFKKWGEEMKNSPKYKAYLESNKAKENYIKHQDKRLAGLEKALGKQVHQFSLEGEYIATYPTLAEASRTSGVAKDTIRYIAMGRIKNPTKYLWKYEK